MEIGMVGLGKMGSNMALRLLRGGHEVTVYDPRPDAVEALIKPGATGTASLAELVENLTRPKAIWMMVPSGQATEDTVSNLSRLLAAEDVIIDGGNSRYTDSIRRATSLKEKGILFLDAGVSGGVWGLEGGYSLMIGGDETAYRRLEPALKTLAPTADTGLGLVGPSGAGHFAKMVHNGIEYGLMEAYAEGFELMQAKKELGLDLTQVAEIWRHGSVVRSWLLDLAAAALKEDPGLTRIQPYVEDTGEGRWTVEEAIELAVPLPVITQAVQARFRSRQAKPFAARLLAALRQQFGGHSVKKE
ncbi:MAG: phosphogluconate dehydrogenase (NAD(+)-dependent, decarboxylating) [Dehalococcoidales bacterium]